MVLYCIITYLIALGFIIEGEDLRDFKAVWLIYALAGLIAVPIMLGIFISEVADYIKEQKRKIK